MSNYRRPPLKRLLAYWGVAILSCTIVAITTFAVWQDFASFKSCSVNSNDLSVTTCGKASFNVGDALLSLLFIASLALVVSLFTHAFRLTRRPA